MNWTQCFILIGCMVFGGSWSAGAYDRGGESSSAYDEYTERVDDGTILPEGDENPGKGYVRVTGVPLSVNVGIPGFWRLTVRPGFIWEEGRWMGDQYIPGYYRPLHDRGRNWSWVPGHWGGDRWLPGHWRLSFRSGFTWIEGHWTREGEWEEGFWRPLEAPPRGKVWEPGFWGESGWVEGFWRWEVRPGFIWIGGEWDSHGRWLSGRWERTLGQQAWEHGYWDRRDNQWHAGHRVNISYNRSRVQRHGFYNLRGEWVSPYGSSGSGDIRPERVPVKSERRWEKNRETWHEKPFDTYAPVHHDESERNGSKLVEEQPDSHAQPNQNNSSGHVHRVPHGLGSGKETTGDAVENHDLENINH